MPGFEGQTFNGPVGVVNGADQPSGDDFQFPKSLQCNCPDQSRPGTCSSHMFTNPELWFFDKNKIEGTPILKLAMVKR